MTHFIKNIDGTVEQDKVFVCDRMLHKKGQIDPIEDLNVNMRFDQNGEVSFKVYKNNNGNTHPYWDKIDDIGIILVEGKGYFEISVPKSEDKTVYKTVNGITLGEAETTQTNITENFNNEDDAEWDQTSNSAYGRTVLYDAQNPNHSMLHRIFKHMPHYSIGHVDASVAILQGTFSCENTTIYNFLQTIAEEFECIFVFDKFDRIVNCYDLKDHCNREECIRSGKHRKVKDGVCTCCGLSDRVSYGYGEYTGVHINTENLAEILTVTPDKDSVKNTFKIVGGDDIITNLIGQRLMDGNKITKFSEYQMGQMSPELREALITHDNLVNSYQSRYNSLWDTYNQCVEDIEYYQSGMMPSFQSEKNTAQKVYDKLFGINGKIQVVYMSSSSQGGKGLLNSVKTQCNWFVPKEYAVELTYIDFYPLNYLSFSVKIYLKIAYRNDNDSDEIKSGYECTNNVTLPVKNGYEMVDHKDPNTGNPIYTTDYYGYIKNQIDMVLKKADAIEEKIVFNPPITSNTNSFNPDAYKEYDEKANYQNLSNIHYTMYCINRLQSYRDAYESCSQVVSRLNNGIAQETELNDYAPDNNQKLSLNGNILTYITEGGGISNIYEDLIGKYYRYVQCIDARIQYLNDKVDALTKTKKNTEDEIDSIKNICKLESFIKNNYGEGYWTELCSFIREDVYNNSNFFAEGLSQADINENIEKLIDRAEEELEKACEITYSITSTVDNLLTLDDFKPFWNKFDLGKWIMCTIDNYTYKLRLVGITYNYGELEHIGLEFSTTTKVKDPIADIKSVLSNASNIATNFSAVSRQAEKGNMANEEFAVMKQYGLDVANTMIQNSGVGEYTLNEYGFTGRIWNDDKNGYDDKQIRIINNLLCFTSDAWKHTRLALGDIIYYDDDIGDYRWAYGLNAEVLISNLVLSRYLKIYNKSGTYSMTDSGLLMKSTDRKSWILMKPNNPSMEFVMNNDAILKFNTNDKPMTLWLKGMLEAGIVKASTFIGGFIKSLNWGGADQANSTQIDTLPPGNGCFWDLNNSKLVMVGNGRKIFDFNSSSDGKLRILSGIVTSILQSYDYVAGTIGMCINLEDKFIEIYDSNNRELLSFNLNNNNILRLGKWNVDPDKIYADNVNNHVIFHSNGDIISYSSSSVNPYCAALVGGKYAFGTYDSTQGNMINDYAGYIDISRDGLYAKSREACMSNDNRYLFELNVPEDRITITSHSSNPAIHIQNTTGDALFLENKDTDQANKAFHAKVWTQYEDENGRTKKTFHYISMFGESHKDRVIFRADNGDDNGPLDETSFKPCHNSAIGTTNYPWGEIYGVKIVAKDELLVRNESILSDLKLKDVIGRIDNKKALEFINALEPIEYTFKDGTAKRKHMGFGAQTTAQTAKDLGIDNLALYNASVIGDDGEEYYFDENVDDEKLLWRLRYSEFIAPMVSSIQLLSQENEEQKEEIDRLNTEINDMKKEIEDLKNLVKTALNKG